MTTQSDTLVIGGGIIGLMTARELARRGRRVAVLDRGRTGAEASYAAGGILCPLEPWRLPGPLRQLAARALDEYPKLVAELEEAGGCRIGLRRTGLLLLDDGAFDHARHWAREYGFHCRQLTAGSVAELEPELQAPEGALQFPDMANVYAADLMEALRRELSGLGVLHESIEVQGICHKGGRLTGVITTDGDMEAENVVVAGGAWSAVMLEALGRTLPVRPVRGQIIQYPAGAVTLERMVLCGRRYLVPRPGGELIVGSTLEESGFDADTTDSGRHELATAAEGMLPRLATVPIEAHWAGLRPGAPDGMPFIGPVEGVTGLYLNTGHYQNGILLAPLSGRLAANLVCGESPDLDPAPFLPSRRMVSRS